MSVVECRSTLIEVAQHLLEQVQAVDERQLEGPAEQFLRVVPSEELIARHLIDRHVRNERLLDVRLRVDADRGRTRARLLQRESLVDTDLEVVRRLEDPVDPLQYLVVGGAGEARQGLVEVLGEKGRVAGFVGCASMRPEL